MAVSAYRRHTIAETFAQICNHQTPWVAIGNFLNDWCTIPLNIAVISSRLLLFLFPILICSVGPLFVLQWWNGSVRKQTYEYLHGWRRNIIFLSIPWFYYTDLNSRSWLLATTPAPFKMLNIFIGDRAFLHKN